MSGIAVWILVPLGIAVVATRRRSLAVALLTVQSLVLVGVALEDARTGPDVIAALALAARAVGLAALLLILVARTREAGPVRSRIDPLARTGLAVVLALALTGLLPNIGLVSRGSEIAAISLAAFGLTITATRRATLFQVMGLVLVENGIALAALRLPGGASPAIEVGVAIDLTLVVLVAAAFHWRIFQAFGSGDSITLRSLRD